MGLSRKLERRLLATVASWLPASLLAAMVSIATPAWAAPANVLAARTLKPARALHPKLVSGQTPSPGHPPTPHSLPLRVPDPQEYSAAKTAAKRRYRAWRQRHAQALTATGVQPASAGPQLMSKPSPRTGLIEGFNQPGLAGDKANTRGTPPDPTGAIGPGYYIELVNSELAVYSRADLETPLATEGEDEFTGGTSTCDGQVRWDQQAERWEYASLDCGETFGYSYGWSKNADPTDLKEGWCKYHESTGTLLYDYPKLGGDDEYLLIGANKYEITSAEEKYLGSNLFVIPKPLAGLATCPPAPTITEFPVPAFTPVPANIFGSSFAGYAVAADYPEKSEPTPDHLRLFTVTKPLATPVVSESSVTVPGYTMPAGVPQPGTTDELDSSDTRITQAVATEEPLSHELAIWTQHTISTTLFGPSAVQWFELKPGSSTPVQTGVIEVPEGNFAFNAAISPTTAGDSAVINYDVGGPKTLVQLRAQSRVPVLAADTMAGEVTLAQSAAVDNDFTCPSAKTKYSGGTCRWGDYAGASPDPYNPEAVWGSNQFNGPLHAVQYAAQWRTENFELIADTPPVASFSVSTTSPASGEAVRFDGSASHDPDGTIASYRWSFGDSSPEPIGPNANPVSHTYSNPGKYVVTLTVTDNKGLSDSTEMEITVDAPPSASFVVSSPSPTATAPVGFDASASKDPDGTIASYAWSFGDGMTASDATPTHTYAKPGQYTVSLTVTDNGGKSTSVSQSVTIADAPPSASLAVTSIAPIAGQPVGYDASGSKDPDGTIASYAWSFGDGGSASGAQASHAYTKAGAYTTRLTVIDSGGVSVIAEQTIVVAPPPNVVTVKSVKQNRKTGGVTLSVLVPWAGVLSASDASSAKSSGLPTFFAQALSLSDPSLRATAAGSKRRPKRRPALVKPVSVSAPQAGTVALQISPTSAALAQLKRKRRLTVEARITFTPQYGSPGEITRAVVLQLAPRKRHR